MIRALREIVSPGRSAAFEEHERLTEAAASEDLQADRALVMQALRHNGPVEQRRWFAHGRAPATGGVMPYIAAKIDFFGHEVITEDELRFALDLLGRNPDAPMSRARLPVLRAILHDRLHQNPAICGWCSTGFKASCPRHGPPEVRAQAMIVRDAAEAEFGVPLVRRLLHLLTERTIA